MQITFRSAMLMSFEIELQNRLTLFAKPVSHNNLCVSYVANMAFVLRSASGDILNAVGVFRAASKIIRSGRVFDKLHRDAINPHGFQPRRGTFVEQIVVVKCLTIKRERDICE